MNQAAAALLGPSASRATLAGQRLRRLVAAAGFDAHLTKPVDVERLLAVIRKVSGLA